jgi:hypothetical protein
MEKNMKTVTKLSSNGWNLRNTVNEVFNKGSKGRVSIRIDNINEDKSGFVIGLGRVGLGNDLFSTKEMVAVSAAGSKHT